MLYVYLEACKDALFIVGVDNAQEDAHALFELALAFAQYAMQLAVHLNGVAINAHSFKAGRAQRVCTISW
jgi:hypothetical protein